MSVLCHVLCHVLCAVCCEYVMCVCVVAVAKATPSLLSSVESAHLYGLYDVRGLAGRTACILRGEVDGGTFEGQARYERRDVHR